MSLPEAFQEQMRAQLGKAYDDFIEALDAPPPVSIRLNPFKRIYWLENSGKVKWYSDGIYLKERPVFTLDPRFHAGGYYVQEASSMFVGEAVRQLVDTGRPLRALDLAAAPGGKSTLLADTLPPGSFLLCNEVIRSRYQVLQENLTRWGHSGVHSANHDPRDFSGLAGFFDLVLLDAPCSGEGLFRKDKQAVYEWSPGQVQLCSGRQRRILTDALSLVRPGGLLIYCTCTYNRQENEDNAAWIAEQNAFELCALDIPEDWAIASAGIGYQFYPHRVRGEGFYLAAFRREAGPEESLGQPRPFDQLTPLPRRLREALQPWVHPLEQLVFYQKPKGGILAFPAAQEPAARVVSHHLRRLALGTGIGVFKGRDFVPSHDLALSTLTSPTLPAVDLDREQALRFLKKDRLELSPIPQGWTLVRYEGLNLGWIKGLKNRINNYLPKNWRIRMEVT